MYGWFVPSAQAFEVRPAIQELTVEAGSSTERVLFVKNTDGYPLDLFLRVQKFIAGTNGAPIFLDPADTQGLPEWIGVSAPEFRLAPGEERAIRVRISPPREATQGGSYAGIFVAEKPLPRGAIDSARRIATLWLVSVTQENTSLVPSVRATVDWKKSMNMFRRSGEVAVRIQNTGNVHTVARLTTQHMGEREVRLLPGETRDVLFTQSRSFFTLVSREQIDVFLKGTSTSVRVGSWQAINGWAVLSLVFFVGICATFVLWRVRARAGRRPFV